jgi:adenylate kinase
MNIIILGPQGSGKGTQAKILVEKYKLFYMESGDLSRELAKNNPKIKDIMTRGELIPQGMMTEYVSEYLEKNCPDGKNILFDGYPRFVPQYQYLKDWLVGKNSKIDVVILLEISQEETVKRLSGRRVCTKCEANYNLFTSPKPKTATKCDICGGELIQRYDDYPEAIVERLKEFHRNTDPMVEMIEKEGLLFRIDGERPIEEISADLEKIVGSKNG